MTARNRQRKKDTRKNPGSLARRLLGFLASWPPCFLASWLSGLLASWVLVSLASWVASWAPGFLASLITFSNAFIRSTIKMSILISITFFAMNTYYYHHLTSRVATFFCSGGGLLIHVHMSLCVLQMGEELCLPNPPVIFSNHISKNQICRQLLHQFQTVSASQKMHRMQLSS